MEELVQRYAGLKEALEDEYRGRTLRIVFHGSVKDVMHMFHPDLENSRWVHVVPSDGRTYSYTEVLTTSQVLEWLDTHKDHYTVQEGA